MKTTFFLILLSWAFVSCTKNKLNVPINQAAVVYQNNPATWNNNITISWNKLIEESRCPNNADCFWEGMAEVNFKVEGLSSVPIYISLGTLTSAPTNFSPNEIDTLGYHFKMINLTPYPEAFGSIDEKDYRATLIVSK